MTKDVDNVVAYWKDRVDRQNRRRVYSPRLYATRYTAAVVTPLAPSVARKKKRPRSK